MGMINVLGTARMFAMVKLISVVMFLAPIGVATNAIAKGERADNNDKQVVMFSSAYCPSCVHAKRFFSENDIAYTEFDIETSAAARSYFERLGGRGTPLLMINNRRMQGFDEPRFWRYYQLERR